MRKRLIRFSMLFIATAPVILSQVVSFGVKGGIPFTDATGKNDESRPYLIGPSIEFRLPARFAVETGFLYQRIGNTTTSTLLEPSGASFFTNRQRGNSFEIPVLGKYYFRPVKSGWQPYLGTGYVFRTIDIHSDVSGFSSSAIAPPNAFAAHYNYGFGVDVGAMTAAGVRYRKGRVAFLPEIRYTRWSRSDSGVSRQNEAGLLLGITF